MRFGVHLPVVDFGALVKSSGSVTVDSSWHVGVVLGRQTENARFEAEYQEGNLDIMGLALGAVVRTGPDASGRYRALMANAYRTFTLSPAVEAYAGLGIGMGSVMLPALAPVGACNCFRQASKTDFAFQARVGAEYLTATGDRLFLQYTWLRLPAADSGSVVPSVSYPHTSVGTVSGGFRKKF